MSNQGDNDGRPADDVLGRADALLNRHRAAVAPAADPRDIPTLTEAVRQAAMGVEGWTMQM